MAGTEQCIGIRFLSNQSSKGKGVVFAVGHPAVAEKGGVVGASKSSGHLSSLLPPPDRRGLELGGCCWVGAWLLPYGWLVGFLPNFRFTGFVPPLSSSRSWFLVLWLSAFRGCNHFVVASRAV